MEMLVDLELKPELRGWGPRAVPGASACRAILLRVTDRLRFEAVVSLSSNVLRVAFDGFLGACQRRQILTISHQLSWHIMGRLHQDLSSSKCNENPEM